MKLRASTDASGLRTNLDLRVSGKSDIQITNRASESIMSDPVRKQLFKLREVLNGLHALLRSF